MNDDPQALAVRLVALRGDQPSDATIVVIRAGERGLSDETLRRTAQLSQTEFGFYVPVPDG